MFVNELKQGGIRALLMYDDTLFDNFTTPDGIDKNAAIDNILYKYGDTPLHTPDPAIIKYYLGKWSERRGALWTRYKETAEAEYNPIENYDRYEEGTDATENTVSADNATTYQSDTKHERTLNLHTHGNIGVTTAAHMQSELMDLIPRFDVYEFIADDFKSEFCLYLYSEV